MKTRIFIAVLALLGLGHSASAQMFMLPASHGGGGIVPPPVTSAPVMEFDPEVAGLDFPNDGATAALSGVSLTLTAKPGQYDGNVITRAYNWHTVNAPLTSLGTGASLAINTATTPALVGQAIEVDETVSGLGGSLKRTSHWFGPIELAAPVAPEEPESDVAFGPNLGPTTLPVSPANFLQCYGPGTFQHAVFPGGAIPPCQPNTATGHVWYFDPINGATQAAGADGRTRTTAFKDATAIFSFGVSGYTGRLFRSVILPGDIIYLNPGDATHSIGDIVGGFNVGAISTDDGTAAGNIGWTWVMPDPAASSMPIVHSLSFSGAVGIIFNGFGIENYRTGAIGVGLNGAAPTLTVHDVLFEHLSIDQQVGHAADPWLNSHYPLSGGTSDGTVVTASAVLTRAGGEDSFKGVAAASINSTTLAMASIPFHDVYIFSPGFFQTTTAVTFGNKVDPNASGIPLGTMTRAVNGITGYTIAGSVNGTTASDLLTNSSHAGLIGHLQAGSPFASTTTLGAVTGNGTTYAVVGNGTTGVQTLYTWNGSAWVSIGTILPVTATGNLVYNVFANAVVATPRTAHWNGASWDDLGPIGVTIGPCDPVTDKASGCPDKPYVDANTGLTLSGSGHDNVPGCDPLISSVAGSTINYQGGCPLSGSPPPWNGTTRALSGTVLIGTQAIGENVSMTDALVLTPKGAFTSVDWSGSGGPAVSVTGLPNPSADKTPSKPNNFTGSKYVSLKDNIIRNENGGIIVQRTTNSIIYNSKIKFFAVDAIDIYSDNRIWSIHNWISDSTNTWAHQDGIQNAIDGTGVGYVYFGSAEIENEIYEVTDATNYLPKGLEAITRTDENGWNNYTAANIAIATTNGIVPLGPYSVVVNNDSIGQRVGLGWNSKGGFATSPLGGLLANNVSNSIVSGSGVGTPCDPVTGSLINAETNLSIPVVPGTGTNTLTVCNGSVLINGPTPGAFTDAQNWTGADWRSGVSGVSALFTSYHPTDPPPMPAPGGWLQNTWGGSTGVNNLCVQGTFPGACDSSVSGSVNLRPNASFAGTTATLLGTVSSMFSLPQTGTIGEAYLLNRQAICFSGQTAQCGPNGTIWEPGLMVRIGNSLTDATLNWQHTIDTANPLNFLTLPYNPGIIGAGTNLGAQAPIADIAGGPWTNPPSIGAYELH